MGASPAAHVEEADFVHSVLDSASRGTHWENTHTKAYPGVAHVPCPARATQGKTPGTCFGLKPVARKWLYRGRY